MTLVLWKWLMNFFFINDTATTEIYTLSLHDALPISKTLSKELKTVFHRLWKYRENERIRALHLRTEEHTSELQSH